MAEFFSKKIARVFAEFGQLCVGIDPHDELLLENGFDTDVESLEMFSFKLLDQIGDQAGIVKPQISFFERHGSKGYLVLEKLLTEAQSRKLLVIADAKRGDIGSTMQAYSDAWLAKDAPFICDAVTLNPYLGVGALKPAISTAFERGKGIFVLSATSNSEARSIQNASVSGQSVAQSVINEVVIMNQTLSLDRATFGSLGVVIGANLGVSGFDLSFKDEQEHCRTIILAPGFGYQGANLSQAKSLFGNKASDVIYTVSRSALRDGLGNVSRSIAADQAELKFALA